VGAGSVVLVATPDGILRSGRLSSGLAPACPADTSLAPGLAFRASPLPSLLSSLTPPGLSGHLPSMLLVFVGGPETVGTARPAKAAGPNVEVGIPCPPRTAEAVFPVLVLDCAGIREGYGAFPGVDSLVLQITPDGLL